MSPGTTDTTGAGGETGTVTIETGRVGGATVTMTTGVEITGVKTREEKETGIGLLIMI